MKRQRIDRYDGPTSLGIDVSHHNGPVNWGEVARGMAGMPDGRKLPVDFAIIRVGDGKDLDTRFADNWRDARAAGIRRGIYQYFRGDRGGAFQADLLLRAVVDAGGWAPGDLPPAIDIEQGAWQGLRGGITQDEDPDDELEDVPTLTVIQEMDTWIATVRAALQVDPIIYTGQKWHWGISQPYPELAVGYGACPLWIASYTRVARMPVDRHGKGAPWATWTMHQFSSKGVCDGVRRNVDLNRFRGGQAELATLGMGIPSCS